MPPPEGEPHLILAELSPQPLHVLRCLVDLRCQAGRVAHLRVLLINVLHLTQGLAAQEREREEVRETRERKGERESE